MKTILLVMAGLCLSQVAEAMNIKKGDVEVQGSLNLSSYNSYGSAFQGGKRQTYFNLGAGSQYFFADHFSAGLETTISYFSGQRAVYSVAPIFTKYFLVGEKVAPYVSLKPITFNSEWLESSSIRVGTKIFLTESVSVGPALEYSKAWGGGDNLSLLGLFSIHL